MRDGPEALISVPSSSNGRPSQMNEREIKR